MLARTLFSRRYRLIDTEQGDQVCEMRLLESEALASNNLFRDKNFKYRWERV